MPQMRDEPANECRNDNCCATHGGCSLFGHMVSWTKVFLAQNGLTATNAAEKANEVASSE